ncbi:MAG: ParB/RepB/Spo0J family partition protein [Clostridiales bacterium]|nr:ParB/RepB/Spo0J family partition protein [Clostridiales bacterium]
MSAIKNRGLGKGLEALFSDVEISVDDLDKTSEQARIHQIDIHEIKPSKNQPRTHFSEDRLQELASSIEEHGILQPIIVRKIDNGYAIVAGERRWRAAIKAGLKEVPCIIKELTEEENMLLALIENMQREDLNPIEEAKGLNTMITSFGLTQEQVSKSVGKSRPYITNCLRLLKLPESVQQMVVDGKLSSGHARAIAGVSDSEKQMALAKKCVESGWTVRDIENHIKDEKSKSSRKKARPRKFNRDIMILEEELKDIFGTKVNIVLGAKKGKIELEYYSKEELDRLIDMLFKLK